MPRDRLCLKNRAVSAAFLSGSIAGCLLSSTLYVLWSGYLVNSLYPAQQTIPVSLLLSNDWRHHDRSWALSSELQSKKRLMIVLPTSRAKVHDAIAMLNVSRPSWVRILAVDYSILVGGEGASLPSVSWLRDMHDFHEGEATTRELFFILKYLHRHFVHQYHWFMLASPSAYVSVDNLMDTLANIDASRPVYMGCFAHENPDIMAALNLLPNEYYCQWGPGIILSDTALVSIVHHLDSCWHHIEPHLNLGRGDVELGRCFSRKLGIFCTSSHEVRKFWRNRTILSRIYCNKGWRKGLPLLLFTPQ